MNLQRNLFHSRPTKEMLVNSTFSEPSCMSQKKKKIQNTAVQINNHLYRKISVISRGLYIFCRVT